MVKSRRWASSIASQRSLPLPSVIQFIVSESTTAERNSTSAVQLLFDLARPSHLGPGVFAPIPP